MVFRNKRGQAAMEFLMTYGWAILVVLVVIGALAYFGVLTPETFLPEKCTFPIQLGCQDYRVTTATTPDSITLVLSNGAGRDMRIQRVAVSGAAINDGAAGLDVCVDATAQDVTNGQQKTFTAATADCVLTNTGKSKNKYNITVLYNWIDSPGIAHTMSGELLAKTETS